MQLQHLVLAMAQDYDGTGASEGGGIIAALMGGVFFIVWLGVVGIIIASMWKIFTKANQPGWAALVPIYNLYVLTQIVGRPILWFILCFVPCINFVAIVMITIDLAKSFGKSVGFAIGMMVVPFICYPMLAFGDARYQGPAAAQG